MGLSNGIVKAILKDRSGFLWIGTLNGLNCFDGSHIKVWKADPNDSTRLINDAIYGLCEDKKGNIWIACNAGISRYERNKNLFYNYVLINSVSGKRSLGTSNGILCTRKGEIVTYSSSGIFIYDEKSNRFVHFPELKKEGKLNADFIANNSLLEDHQKHGVWIATDKGMKYFDLDSKTYFSYTNNPEKLTVFNDHNCGPAVWDNNRNLVFADDDAQTITTWSPSENKLSSISFSHWPGKPEYFESILSDQSGNLWLSSLQASSFLLERNGKSLFRIQNSPSVQHSISGTVFSAAYQDESGTVFFGTTNGISYYNPNHDLISIIPFPDSVSHNRKYYLHQMLGADKQGKLWFTPSYKYLLRYNPATAKYESFDILKGVSSLKDESIRISSMQAMDDKIYFGTTNGIYVYDVGVSSFQKLKSIPGLDGKYILCMMMTKDHQLWFTHHNNGVFCYNTINDSFRHFKKDSLDSNSFTSAYVYEILEDKKGNIWFCAEREGLICFEKNTEKFTYYEKKQNSSETEIYYSVALDDENNLWTLGFLSGLRKFSIAKKQFEKDERIKNLFSLTYNKLDIFSSQLWMAYYSEYTVLNLKSGSVWNFKVDHGIANADYANFFTRLPDGRVAAESLNGFLIFNPAVLNNPLPLQPITFSGFEAGNMILPFISSDTIIQLKARQNFFSVSFSTLSLLHNPNLQFAYQLKGLSDEWIYCGNRQTAYFTNLSGGKYVFKVRMQDSNGKWTESSTALSVHISSFFYATTWFRLLLIALLISCIVWLLRLQRKRALKKDAERAIAYFADSLHGKNKVEELLWDITHNVITRTNLVDCVVYLLDKKRNVLVQKAAWGNKSPEQYKIINPIEIPAGSGIVGSAALNGKPVVVGDTSKDPRYIADDLNRSSELAVPIIAEGEVIGVIDSEHPKKNFFTSDHINLLQTIASITATKIIKAQKEMEVTDKEKKVKDLQEQIAYTRQQALQAQMNPHFIFNCLNSINGFILKNDVATASTFLIKFSKLIRLILEHSNEKSISLQSELDALKLYIEMEILRFEGKFRYEIKTTDDVFAEEIRVPPLILQPFVENAIWHGLLHKQGDGLLSINLNIEDNTLQCIIEDNGIGRKASQQMKSSVVPNKKSLGLKLTRERIDLLQEPGSKKSGVEIVDLENEKGEPAGTRIIISLPL